MPDRIPLTEQIAELKREAAIRERAYPTFVARGQFSQADADKQRARLSAAISTLEWLQRNEAKVRTLAGPSADASWGDR